ncbi:hypothetical protein J2W30_005864 [Variovorax boronicumulans]|uniref:hypothetical protein n=1 Tax=Variovorax boronicumulans TaxID=436515 RepID=UPI00278ACEDE|nr:hypothetical protein [Variovorax boronicumulans]MDQ0038077.1 hypothetical protein [Variovorax boronicumulans]
MSSYSYLWDGTEPGWTLLKIHRSMTSVAVLFDERGPSIQEIQALRGAVPSFSTMSAQQAVQQLRESRRVDLGELDTRAARKLVKDLKDRGLRVEERSVDLTGYMPFNEISKRALVIEGEAMAKEVAAEGLRRGLPVRHVET